VRQVAQTATADAAQKLRRHSLAALAQNSHRASCSVHVQSDISLHRCSPVWKWKLRYSKNRVCTLPPGRTPFRFNYPRGTNKKRERRRHAPMMPIPHPVASAVLKPVVLLTHIGGYANRGKKGWFLLAVASMQFTAGCFLDRVSAPVRVFRWCAKVSRCRKCRRRSGPSLECSDSTRTSSSRPERGGRTVKPVR
jgi:hypothetical protein